MLILLMCKIFSYKALCLKILSSSLGGGEKYSGECLWLVSGCLGLCDLGDAVTNMDWDEMVRDVRVTLTAARHIRAW